MFGRRDSIEELTMRLGSLELAGRLGAPPGAVGLAIFAHGRGSNPRDRHVAEALRARGLATLQCDLVLASEEDARRFDVELLAERLALVTRWLRDRSPLAHLPRGYIGAGVGAAAALVAAARTPDAVRAIVVRGGRPDAAGAALPLVRVPSLFVVGGEDLETLEANRAAVSRMTIPTQLAIVPGIGRGFEQPGALDEVAQLAGEWFVDHFVQAFGELAGVPAAWGRLFRDRRAAGERLARALAHLAGPDVLVFGLPRGGVPVADEIARALDAPLDVWLVRKIGMPIQPELGMGAIAEGAAVVLDPTIVQWSGATAAEVRAIIHRRAAEIRRRAMLYRGAAPPPDLAGRTAILVDDGIATGGALRAAIRGARRRGAARVVIAAPVASAEAAEVLRADADEVVCLATPRHLMSAGAWYHDVRQVSDEEVCNILADARRRHGVRPHARGRHAGGKTGLSA